MSMSDARQFAELSARVDTLEELCRSLSASVDALEGRVFGIDLHEEVLGPVADEAARDGLRAMLKERRQVAVDGDTLVPAPPAEVVAGDPVPEGVVDLASDPGLKDKLAALQGGDAALSATSTATQNTPSRPSLRK